MATLDSAPAQQPLKVTHELLSAAPEEGNMEFDLGNLLAYDPSPLDTEQFRTDPSGACLALATTITQALVARIFSLPTERSQAGPIAKLPPPTTPLPRAKPLPKPREPTRWEKFAQQKGIQKRKRSKLVFDESSKEWRRRYGYKKAGDESEIPVLEAKPSDQVGEDPFTKMAQDKKERVKTNDRRQHANLKATAKLHGRDSLPATLRLTANLPEPGKPLLLKQGQRKDEIKVASRRAGISTASMGKFDRRAEGEKEGERLPLGKRRKVLPVVDSSGGEAQRAGALVDRLLRERAEDVLDVGRAVGQMEAQRREERHQQKRRQYERDGAAEGGGGRGGGRGRGGKAGGRGGGGKAGGRGGRGGGRKGGRR